MKESVLSLYKTTIQHRIFYFQIAPKYQISFMTNPINIILGIWLLGYGI